MSQPQILIHQMSYHSVPEETTLFNQLTYSFLQQKIGLIGRNGVGKSTLIKLIIGELRPHSGSIQIDGTLAYVPQNFSLSQEITVANFLGCEQKMKALQRIAQGSLETRDYEILNEDWDIKERIYNQLAVFGLENIEYDRKIKSLSGGELTKLLLVKAFISNADFLLLDEPTNHLDQSGRLQLYHAIEKWQGGLIIASHDRTLLNLMEQMVELTTLGLFCYGGNYDDYVEQKFIIQTANEHDLSDAKSFLKTVKNSVKTSREKHAKKQTYGRELKRNGSIDKLSANSKKGRSERTQSKLLIKEECMMKQAEERLKIAKEKIEIYETIDVNIPETFVPNGKMILDIENLNFSYPNNPIIRDFNLKMQGAERIALYGDNGSGKTTLIKLILQELKANYGKISLGTNRINYLDQNAHLLQPQLSILNNFLALNKEVTVNEAHYCLAQFLFKNIATHKLVRDLSGGEKLRALLACILMSKQPPQLLILDEPTNHLDINSITSIESALKNYQGAMIVISHDETFLKNISVTKCIFAPFKNGSL